jgi:hypothetical protein
MRYEQRKMEKNLKGSGVVLDVPDIRGWAGDVI